MKRAKMIDPKAHTGKATTVADMTREIGKVYGETRDAAIKRCVTRYYSRVGTLIECQPAKSPKARKVSKPKASKPKARKASKPKASKPAPAPAAAPGPGV